MGTGEIGTGEDGKLQSELETRTQANPSHDTNPFKSRSHHRPDASRPLTSPIPTHMTEHQTNNQGTPHRAHILSRTGWGGQAELLHVIPRASALQQETS